MTTLNERLRRLRGKTTLAVLGEKVGLSISYLSDLERGRVAPSLKTLDKIATAYHLSVTQLLMGTEYDRPNWRHH